MVRLAAALAAVAPALVAFSQGRRQRAEHRLGAEVELRPRRVVRVTPLMLSLLRGPGVLAQFGTLDENGDGVIDKSELMYATKDMLNARDVGTSEVRKDVYRHAEDLYEVADIDGDGVWNEAEVEFADYLSQGFYSTRDGRFDSIDDFGIEEAETALRFADFDGDGKVEFSELRRAVERDFRKQGWGEALTNWPTTEADLADLFKKTDVTGDGFLNAREMQFTGFLLYLLAVQMMERQLCGNLDLNDDGILEEVEILRSTSHLGNQPGRERMEKRLLAAFSEADSDGDGSVDGEERLHMASILMQKPA